MLTDQHAVPSASRAGTQSGRRTTPTQRVDHGTRVENWKGSIEYRAARVVEAHHVDDIVRVVTDTERFPSPVRVKGSHHSTTRCIVAQGGTVIDVTRMNRILDIDPAGKTITMQAGVLHIDAARELEKHNLQFFVNIELGNMTVGSGACGGTKDASYFDRQGNAYEFGQVASYVVGFKAVRPDGSILEVDESQPELLEAMRSSYGMLGIIFEVTFRVKELRPMAVEHVAYHVDDFAERVDEIVAGNRSVMLYLFPFLDKVVVEYRYDGKGRAASNSWQWQLRNYVWKTISPGFGKVMTTFVPHEGLRYFLIDHYNRLSVEMLTRVLRGCHTSPADQIIRYSEKGGFASYTFSIWAFPQQSYGATIKAYFEFCRDYYEDNGFRCDMLNVGYAIAQDRSSLFSYTRRGPALTLDPVSTGGRGWHGFLMAYNEFCVQHDGRPLYNQSPLISPLQSKAAFGEEIQAFQKLRRQYDPEDRFYTPYFERMFE